MPHVFISYVRENQKQIDELRNELIKHGVKVWLDRNDIKPGARWQDAIERAIQKGSFFIACFSKEYNERDETYMNEELTLAVNKLRKISTDRIWFIPVKLNECEIPNRLISAGDTLQNLQFAELYKDWNKGIMCILSVIQPKLDNAEDKLKLLARSAFTLGWNLFFIISPDCVDKNAMADDLRVILGILNVKLDYPHPATQHDQYMNMLQSILQTIFSQIRTIHGDIVAGYFILPVNTFITADKIGKTQQLIPFSEILHALELVSRLAPVPEDLQRELQQLEFQYKNHEISNTKSQLLEWANKIHNHFCTDLW